MQQLVITTAVPFGYLIIIVSLAAIFLGACIWLFFSIMAKPIKQLQLITSALLIGFLGLVVWSNFLSDEVEWNPIIVGQEPLVGIWKNENSQLTLQHNGHYSCDGTLCNELGLIGEWRRYQDFEIDLIPAANNSIRWRIAESSGSYQLVSGATGDPDMWHVHVTFTKQNAP